MNDLNFYFCKYKSFLKLIRLKYFSKIKNQRGMSHHKRCGIILYHPTTSKYLLVRGIESKKWGFPKGHMEWGEAEEQTAIREFEEETGLTIHAPFDSRLRFGNNIYFLKTQCEDRLPNIRDKHEIDKVQWFTQNEILNFSKDKCNFGLSMWRKHVNSKQNHYEKIMKSIKWFNRISVPVVSSKESKLLSHTPTVQKPQKVST